MTILSTAKAVVVIAQKHARSMIHFDEMLRKQAFISLMPGCSIPGPGKQAVRVPEPDARSQIPDSMLRKRLNIRLITFEGLVFLV